MVNLHIASILYRIGTLVPLWLICSFCMSWALFFPCFPSHYFLIHFLILRNLLKSLITDGLSICLFTVTINLKKSNSFPGRRKMPSFWIGNPQSFFFVISLLRQYCWLRVMNERKSKICCHEAVHIHFGRLCLASQNGDIIYSPPRMGSASVSVDQELSWRGSSWVLVCRFPMKGWRRILRYVAHCCVHLRSRVLLGDHWAQKVTLCCASDYKDDLICVAIQEGLCAALSGPACFLLATCAVG